MFKRHLLLLLLLALMVPWAAFAQQTLLATSSNESVTTVSNNGTTTATVTGVAAGIATITATMNYQGTDYTATSEVTVEEPSYCTPYFSSTYTGYGLYISGFSTTEGETNISNTGTSLSTGGYGDYYDSYSASAEAGQTIEFTVTPASTVNELMYGMWIDWNKDYDFDDAGETVALESDGIQTNWTGIISIPASTLPGSYRIRIEAMYPYNYTDLDPCVNTTYGEAEDYQLIVLEASSCPKPSNVQLSVLGNEVTVTWGGNALSYNIDINGTVTPNVTSPYVFTGELSTEYIIKMQANCEGNQTSDWTNPKSITTDACLFENQCPITVTLTDAYGDGGGSMYVVDANTYDILAEFILSSGDSQEFQVYVCDGTEIDFYFYATDSYAFENGFVITGPNGEVIAEHEGCLSSSSCNAPDDGVVASYTMDCTGSSCIKPYHVNVEPISFSANLTWDGVSNSYNVRYRTAETTYPTEGSFFDDFENGLGNWTLYTLASGNGFTQIDASVSTNFNGQFYPCPSGKYVTMCRSYDGDDYQADNWLISPLLTIPNTMTYWAVGDDNYPETYYICVSTGSTGTEDFEVVATFETNPNSWTQIEVDLSGYAGQEGYVAFHHYQYGGDFLLIDDVCIGELETLPAGPWNNLTTTETSIQLLGLSANTIYEYQIQSVCDGSESDWTNLATFTTPTRCEVIVDKDNPFQEEFQHSYLMPNCWEVGFPVGEYDYNWEIAQNYDYTDNYCAYSGRHGTVVLYMPTIIIPDESGYAELSFQSKEPASAYYSGGSYDAGGLSIVKVTTDNGLTWTQLWCPSYAELSVTWRTITINLTNFIGQDLIIAFEYQGNEAHEWYVDDVAINVYDKTFVTEGDWSVADNWNPSGVPSLTDDVLINANVTINNGTVAEANSIVFANDKTLTIEEGGQLKHNCYGVRATVKKNITGYGDAATNPTGNYYLIATPSSYIWLNSNYTNMLNNEYDLYRFDQVGDGYGNEWINQEAEGVDFSSLSNGIGYLYANSTSFTLEITDDLKPSNEDVNINLVYSDEAENSMRGWNLVGNPFICNAYIDRPFYILGDGQVDITPQLSGVITPLEGVFVKSENAEDNIVTFSRNEFPQSGGNAVLNANIIREGNRVDVAHIRFGEGKGLDKFQLNPNHTKIYIPQDGRDYAVVYSAGTGEMPVNFEAETNGTYTLSFTNEEVTFSYLHLIDNMTGADVDLLATPSYSFEARTTDYASRFKLVFATGSNADGNFAFFSNGSFIINNEGNATLQVIDVTGRVIKSESINGCANVSVNAATGVYMLRLINGDNVKIQKVVVK